jgi:lysophospholipase L1-like esterase
VLNAGVNGDTSQHGFDRLERDVLSLNPAVVLVGFGGNDMIQRRTMDECFGCMEQIVDRLHAAGALVLLVGIRGSWLYKLDYDARYRELATRKGCLLVPCILDDIWGVPWRMHDVAHPNARGYKMIAERIATVLRPHLQFQSDTNAEP